MEEKETRKREARFGNFKIIKVRKIPNSSHIYVFGWFESCFDLVLFWVGNCMVKKAKNATLLCKPDALRLSEGQVSTFWLMSLRLGEGLACNVPSPDLVKRGGITRA